MLDLPPFKLERYFAQYEFKVQYLLSPSDCESLSMAELLQFADPQTLAMWNELRLGYTESQGHPLLRAEISNMYQAVTPQDVLVAVPEEAIFVAMHTMLRPGDQVIALHPAYQSLYEVARAAGCQVSYWTFTLESGHWQLDLNWLERHLTGRTRLIVLNFPHNPTGYLPTLQELDAILTLARRHGVYIFSDEMYRLLEYAPAGRLPPLCDLYERGISLSGLSKTFALPGLRLGWLATRERALLERWLAFKDYTTICNSAPGEVLGIMALKTKEKLIARNLEIIQKNLRHAGQFFARHPDCFQWIEPLAGPVAFPRWVGDIPLEQFCQDLLDRQGVMVVPGSIFDYPGNHFRVGLGRRNFPQALEWVTDHLNKMR